MKDLYDKHYECGICHLSLQNGQDTMQYSNGEGWAHIGCVVRYGNRSEYLASLKKLALT